jgi:hypothetical protein
MRKALGLIALLISSAVLLVSPALARDRDDYRHGDRRSYGGYYYSYPYSYGYSAPYSYGYSYPYNYDYGYNNGYAYPYGEYSYGYGYPSYSRGYREHEEHERHERDEHRGYNRNYRR